MFLIIFEFIFESFFFAFVCFAFLFVGLLWSCLPAWLPLVRPVPPLRSVAPLSAPRPAPPRVEAARLLPVLRPEVARLPPQRYEAEHAPEHF